MNGKTKTLLGLAAGSLMLGATALTTFAADPAPTADCPATRGVGQGTGRWAGLMSPIDAVAKLLGVSEAEIESQREAGQSLAQVAQANGVEKDALVAAMLADRKATLDQAVAEGKITQERADYMLKNMESQVEVAVDRTETGPMNSRGANATGMGGGRGMRLQDGSAQAPGQGFGQRMGGGFGAGANQ